MRHAISSFAMICIATGCVTPGMSSQAPASASSAADPTTPASTPAEKAVSAGERHWNELPRLSWVQIALLYSRLSKTEPSYDDLAWLDDSVRNQQNEFARRDALSRARSKMVEEDAQISKVHNFVLTSSEVLDSARYDFERKGWTTAEFRDFAGRFREIPQAKLLFSVFFTNRDRFAFIPMPEETAREVSTRWLGQVDYDIECQTLRTKSITMHPVGSTSNSPADVQQQQLFVKIVRVRVRPHDAQMPTFADIVLNEEEPPPPSTASRTAKNRSHVTRDQ